MRVIAGVTERAHEYRCLLDGEDISIDCYAADSDEGWVDVYRRNKDGQLYAVNGWNELASERRYGRVELIGPQEA